MKNAVVVIMFFFASAVHAEMPPTYSISNVLAWVGVTIDATSASNLPQRVSATPGDVFLGYMRSFVLNNCGDNYFHMSHNMRMMITGSDDMNSIPLAYLNSFSSTAHDTNVLIKSISNIVTNYNTLVFSVSVKEVNAFDIFDGDFPCSFIYTNSEWKLNGIAE